MVDARVVVSAFTAALPLVDQQVDEVASAVRRLPDAWLGRPSRLPNWSKGHVLTHLARVCNGFTRLAQGAEENEEAAMYDSPAQREQQIAAGATRSARDQRDDLRNSWRRLRQLWVALPQAALTRPVRLFSGSRALAGDIPRLLLTELCLHRTDLDLGYEWNAWPDVVIDDVYRRAVGRFSTHPDGPAVTLRRDDRSESDRVGTGQTTAAISGSAAELAAWLSGRSPGLTLTQEPDYDPLPALPPWA